MIGLAPLKGKRITLRPLVQGDLGEVLSCYVENPSFFERVNGTSHVGPLTVQMQYDAAEADPRRAMSGIFVDGALAGVLDFAIDPEERSCMIGLVMVRSGLQRRGLAREAVGLLEQALAAAGIERMKAGVEPANREAEPFWERLGFVEAGTFPAQDDLGARFDAILMEKRIVAAV